MNGFLGTGATFRADLNLVLQILMGVGVVGGLAAGKEMAGVVKVVE